jgi:hypothetical protein
MDGQVKPVIDQHEQMTVMDEACLSGETVQ